MFDIVHFLIVSKKSKGRQTELDLTFLPGSSIWGGGNQGENPGDQGGNPGDQGGNPGDQGGNPGNPSAGSYNPFPSGHIPLPPGTFGAY